MKVIGGGCLDILAVVSEPLTRRILKHLIERAGHWCVFVSSESDAFDALDRMTFDVIIVDIETNGLDSVPFICLLKIAQLGLPHLPIVALTINQSQSFKRQLDEIGVEVTLAKPVAPNTLLDTLSMMVEMKATGSED